MIALALVGLVLAAIPCAVFLLNLPRYRPAPPAGPVRRASLLIPARDEERTIGAALEAALASRGVDLEVVVLDDGSTDRTADVVASIAARDLRVRLLRGVALPPGWCGKPHACAALAREARHDLLAFVDADVRLAPDGLARAIAFLEASGADLVSGVPRQETGTAVEALVLPLIHVLLLGFLPLGRMRRSAHPSYGAGCGQLFVVRGEAYVRAGGHGAIRATLHDGVTLPRALRRAGSRTDLFDATDVATCRMFDGATSLWRGLGRNAAEGLGSPALIVPATLVLVGGQVLPPALLLVGLLLPAVVGAEALALGALGTAAVYVPRALAALRFGQGGASAALHPLGVLALVAIQWSAFSRGLLGRPACWRGREYAPAGAQ